MEDIFQMLQKLSQPARAAPFGLYLPNGSSKLLPNWATWKL